MPVVVEREQLGEKVRRLRRQRLLTQEQLAKEAGIAPSTVYMIEAGRGRSYPQFGTLRKLARALDIEPEELVRTEGENA